ncbi:hypothetical protein CLAFUW4_08532 [Fulvia fulva]|uniref:F-box domain-containing protein n=1 Tax=Passalora fulva TaxID=5499 RepID=A0A9Q8LD42_PASFU|nr:uncharacterized protein CLAFUR5_08634 [Fulvia fulva]UJO15169.1 hypothetical protein CLAFUR5_08634 [Fulvia fulva]WPV12868.1 hypothetical protein CLAFUW4_08532 [Fulvia fulva]
MVDQSSSMKTITYENSRAKQVFEIPESLENILTSLSTHDLLLCQRTVSCFRATVKGSIKLKKKPFVAQEPDMALRLNPFLMCAASDIYHDPRITWLEDQAMVRQNAKTDLILCHGHRWWVIREAPAQRYTPWDVWQSASNPGKFALTWTIRESPHPDEVHEEGAGFLMRDAWGRRSQARPEQIVGDDASVWDMQLCHSAGSMDVCCSMVSTGRYSWKLSGQVASRSDKWIYGPPRDFTLREMMDGLERRRMGDIGSMWVKFFETVTRQAVGLVYTNSPVAILRSTRIRRTWALGQRDT